jgi:hypothetical protein
VKVSYVVLLAVFCTFLVGGGRAEAYVGFGYRANESVRVDRCYRGLAWNYAVPFYIVGPKHRYYYRKKCLKR